MVIRFCKLAKLSPFEHVADLRQRETRNISGGCYSGVKLFLVGVPAGQQRCSPPLRDHPERAHARKVAIVRDKSVCIDRQRACRLDSIGELQSQRGSQSDGTLGDVHGEVEYRRTAQLPARRISTRSGG
jgi:hypothetical protein